MRVADHLRVPAPLRHIDSATCVVPGPVEQVGAPGVSYAVPPFLAAEAGAVTIAEEHVVAPARFEHVGTCLSLVGFDPRRDEVAVDLRPAQAVARRRHANSVNRLCARADHLPGSACDVEQVPMAVETANFRAAHHEWLVG